MMTETDAFKADLARLDEWQRGHDKICEERQTEIGRSLKRNEVDHVGMKASLDGVSSRLWGLILTVGAGVIVAIVSMFLKVA